MKLWLIVALLLPSCKEAVDRFEDGPPYVMRFSPKYPAIQIETRDMPLYLIASTETSYVAMGYGPTEYEVTGATECWTVEQKEILMAGATTYDIHANYDRLERLSMAQADLIEMLESRLGAADALIRKGAK